MWLRPYGATSETSSNASRPVNGRLRTSKRATSRRPAVSSRTRQSNTDSHSKSTRSPAGSRTCRTKRRLSCVLTENRGCIPRRKRFNATPGDRPACPAPRPKQPESGRESQALFPWCVRRCRGHPLRSRDSSVPRPLEHPPLRVGLCPRTNGGRRPAARPVTTQITSPDRH